MRSLITQSKYKVRSSEVVELKEHAGVSYTVGNLYCESQILEIRVLASEGSNVSLYSRSNGSMILTGAR